MAQSTIHFDNLDYDAYSRMAQDTTLTVYEKVGFPDSYRKGYESVILADIVSKLKLDQMKALQVLDIGCGCSPLTESLINYCHKRHQLVCMDSPAMLAQISHSNAILLDGKFPDYPDLELMYPQGFDAILLYSVYQYIYPQFSVEYFVQQLKAIMKPNSWALIGDLPNRSMRNRFFASQTGREAHRQFANDESSPPIEEIREGDVTDDVVLHLISYARSMGIQGFVVPQPDTLPMFNRREDILLWRQ